MQGRVAALSGFGPPDVAHMLHHAWFAEVMLLPASHPPGFAGFKWKLIWLEGDA